MKLLGTIEQLCHEFSVCVDSLSPEVLAVEVFKNARLKVAFGKAKREHTRAGVTIRWWIELNAKLWADRTELVDTFTHEVAHVVAFAQGGSTGHGPIWSRAHRALGGSGKQFATVTSAAALGIERQRKLIGICNDCDKEFFGVQRLRANRAYRHNGKSKCGGRVIRVLS